MLACFYPRDRVASYRACAHKSRIDLIGQRLIEQRYLRTVIAQHLREWLRFVTYLEGRGFGLPLDSRRSEVQAYVAQRLHTCRSASRARFVRSSVRIFLEADEHGRFRRRIANVPRPMPPWLTTVVRQYVTFLQAHRGLAPRTVAKHVWQITRFGECLERSGLTRLEAIAPLHIQRFLAQLGVLAPVTRTAYATTLRSFLRWAYLAGSLRTDLRPAVTAPRRFRQRSIRDVLTDSEVMRILSGVDRSSAIGRRDYAVLILAARYGLRPCDIRDLRLEALQWREGTVSIQQSKTGRVLTLPLLPDVADALIAYLRNGRPATTARHVFVRHRAPFEPFVAANNLATIMRLALQRAGLDQRAGRRGLYLFRHTLANRMLASECSIKSIGDVLGHTSTESTMEYASINLVALRRVMLSEAEVRA
jgi:integrase